MNEFKVIDECERTEVGEHQIEFGRAPWPCSQLPQFPLLVREIGENKFWETTHDDDARRDDSWMALAWRPG